MNIFVWKSHLDLGALGSIMLSITYLNQQASSAMSRLVAYWARSLLLGNPFVLCNTTIHVSFHISYVPLHKLDGKTPKVGTQGSLRIYEICVLSSNHSQSNLRGSIQPCLMNYIVWLLQNINMDNHISISYRIITYHN